MLSGPVLSDTLISVLCKVRAGLLPLPMDRLLLRVEELGLLSTVPSSFSSLHTIPLPMVHAIYQVLTASQVWDTWCEHHTLLSIPNLLCMKFVNFC